MDVFIKAIALLATVGILAILGLALASLITAFGLVLG